jgi:hypothetical protein
MNIVKQTQLANDVSTPGGPADSEITPATAVVHAPLPAPEQQIIDKFPCGVCMESETERALFHCSQGVYHAGVCAKCFRDGTSDCIICGIAVDRKGVKTIKLA